MASKRLIQSRTLRALSGAVAVVLLRMLAKHLPHDMAKLVADVLTDELVALVVAGATAAAGYWKQCDYLEAASVARAKTVGELIADKETKR
jgi:hypothetical protein